MFVLGMLTIFLIVPIACFLSFIIYEEGFPIKTFFISFFIGVILSIIGINGININTGKGQHTGIITAQDTNGIFIKSTTLYFKTSEQSSQEDKYCVTDDNIKTKLQEIQNSKKSITIEYDKYIDTGLRCETNQIITSIK